MIRNGQYIQDRCEQILWLVLAEIKFLLMNHCILKKIFLFSVLDRFRISRISKIIRKKKFHEFRDFLTNLEWRAIYTIILLYY